MKAADKIKEAKQRKLAHKEAEIDSMSSEEVKNELKQKKLQVFGTNQERTDRLKKYHGIKAKKSGSSKSNVVDKIKEMEEKRNERRK